MANSLQLTGKYLGAGKIETVGQNNTQIRKFWIDCTDNPLYANTPEFQLRGDKVYLPDNIQKGAMVIVHFNIDGRKYTSQTTGKTGVITNLSAWKIDIMQMQSAAAPRQQAAPAQAATQQPNAFAFADDDTSDLPF